MREAETGEVEIPPELGFSVTTIRAMLQFIYSTKIPYLRQMNQLAVMELFKASHFYQNEMLMV